MIKVKELVYVPERQALDSLPEGKVLINTINAHSYVTALHDPLFAEALERGDYLVPDGMSMVQAARWLHSPCQPKERIAGWDLFTFEMEKLNRKGGRCFFMGSSERVLAAIKEKASKAYPNIEVLTYSPPFKAEFSEQDNRQIIASINASDPDLLWIGMTAPKQEKWTYSHWNELNVHCHVGTIGAVFDFFAGTAKRAPLWWQRHSLEWLYRFVQEPRRMWRRAIVSNVRFVWVVVREKFGSGR